jgi:hypothetical protein
MTLKITTVPLVLVMMFTILCTLSAAAAAAMIPSAAIAQEEEDDDDYDDSLDDDDDYDHHQDLASGIVSEVLEDGDAEDESNQEASNTATINPNQEQDLDQTDFNYLEMKLPTSLKTSALPM